MSNAVLEAKKLAHVISHSDNVEQYGNLLIEIDAKLKHLTSIGRMLYPIEKRTNATLDAEWKRCDELIKNFKGRKHQAERCALLDQNFHRLSLEPLRWRDSEGLPRLVVFSLRSPLFRLGVEYNQYYARDSKTLLPQDLPLRVGDCYKDVFEMMVYRRIREEHRSLELSCQFTGCIPDTVKEQIKEAKDKFKLEVFIIAEPEKFIWNKTSFLKVDPLVVGYDGKADRDALWLIADFDTTSVEEALFFHDPKKPSV